MAGFLDRARCAPRTPHSRRVRLAVDRLEGRDCPAAPQLTLHHEPTSGGLVQIWGSVDDEIPSSVVVSFSGVVGGTVSPNALGDISFQAQPSSLGTMYAVAQDSEALSSNTWSGQFTNEVPTVDFQVIEGANKTASLSGYVLDDDPGWRAVTFTGKVSTTAVTNGSSWFSKTATASGLGDIVAATVDAWGQQSDPVTVPLTSQVPVIEDFWGGEGPTAFVFSGRVADEHPAGLVIQFGGLPSLVGRTVTTNEEGCFSVAIPLQPGEGGLATAWVKDQWDQQSEQAQAYVHQTP